VSRPVGHIAVAIVDEQGRETGCRRRPTSMG
jgi:hypothetical protein